jgi:hypothetical protein
MSGIIRRVTAVEKTALHVTLNIGTRVRDNTNRKRILFVDKIDGQYAFLTAMKNSKIGLTKIALHRIYFDDHDDRKHDWTVV